jgi:hypothetical protein
VFFEQLFTLWKYRDDTESGKLFDAALKPHISKFLQAIERTLYADSPITKSRSQVWRQHPGTVNFEQRVAFLLSVASMARNADISGSLGRAVTNVRKRLAKNHLDGEHLVTLLKALREYDPTYFESYADLLGESYEYLSCDFDSLDAFQPFLAFADAFPDRVPSEKMAEAVEDFQRLAESAGDWENDADRVREAATQVEEIGSRFGLDMGDCVEGLEEWARECEKNSIRQYYDDEGGGGTFSQSSCADRDIDSMFSVL